MTRDAQGHVVVAGAGSGMGLECALQLDAAGYRVLPTVRDAEEARALGEAAAARGRSLTAHVMDLTRPDEVHAGVQSILAEAGRIDALVVFAGLGLRGFFEDLGLEEIRRVYEVNVFGLMTLVQAVLPHMRAARQGRIVITTSAAGRMGSMSISGYASSKFAVEGFAECLWQEVAPLGIHVSLLEPGLVLTEHFTRHRNRAARAVNPASPYYRWFCQHESLVDGLLLRGSVTKTDVARVVLRILKVPRPRLRYPVGRKVKLILALRRHLPGEFFERIYWALVRRMVTRPRRVAQGLSELQEARR